jgi:5-methylcytosine-specific restriction enzyme subunit McrC
VAAIPIKNVYYLLCYAWNRLEQGEIVGVDQVPTTELVDLFALVLCDGLRHLARRGLEQGYQLREEELSGVRGRLDVANSVRRFLFMQGRSFCSFDEISADTSANRILKATLECPQWAVRSENIKWQATSETDPDLALLPRLARCRLK